MTEKAENVQFWCVGLSSDRRTNRWRLRLSCGHTVEPPTTMFAIQSVQCHCGYTVVVDYNKQKAWKS